MPKQFHQLSNLPSIITSNCVYTVIEYKVAGAHVAAFHIWSRDSCGTYLNNADDVSILLLVLVAQLNFMVYFFYLCKEFEKWYARVYG